MQLNAAVTADTIARRSGSSSGRKHRRMTPDEKAWIGEHIGTHTPQQMHAVTGLCTDAIRKCIKRLKENNNGDR